MKVVMPALALGGIIVFRTLDFMLFDDSKKPPPPCSTPIATDLLDGQVWNWIDYDNDGDLDAFLTNYSGNGGAVGRANNLYRNDGGGVFVRMTSVQVGNIASDMDFSLANSWGDFDNDGDLDVLITNDTGAPNRYYKNNGNGSFTRIDTGAIVTGTQRHCGATAGDL